MNQHPCAQCGEPTANTKYCTPGCMKAYRRGPARHCANCGAVLKTKQKVTCSYRCSGAAAGDRPRASAATDARVRELWRVEPPIRQADIGAMMEPPVSKAVVQRIARRLELPKRPAPMPRSGRPAKPQPAAPAPSAKRPVTGPVMRRNPTMPPATAHGWPMSTAAVRRAVRPVEAVPKAYQHPKLGAWTFHCRQCAARLLHRVAA